MRLSTASGNARWVPCAVALCIGLALLGCQTQQQQGQQAAGPPAGSTTDPDQAQQEVIAAHEALVRAFEASDADAFIGLLAPTPELLIFHARTDNRFDGLDEVREHLAMMFEGFEEADWSDFHPVVLVDGNVAWVTSQVMISSLGFESPFVGRGTEIWKRYDDGWKLVHGHWSQVPPSRF
jgi:ketosteroid isomerase-like protein